MDDVYPTRTRTASQRQVKVRAIAGAAVAAFLLGSIGTWLLAGSPGAPAGLFQFKSGEQAESPPVPDPEPTSLLPETPPAGGAQPGAAMVAPVGAMEQRLAALEQRIAELDRQTESAAGNAARAEGLLITFAARRAVERGAELGVLGDQLRLRFGDAQPNAVRTVLRAARDPITLDRLVARLEGLAPELVQAPKSEGPIGWLGRELGELFVVRRENSPSPAPARRLARARLFLESGRADAAVAEVRNMPNAVGASDWIADATRYAQAQEALETLELAAILEPRTLRDGTGNSVGQTGQ